MVTADYVLMMEWLQYMQQPKWGDWTVLFGWLEMDDKFAIVFIDFSGGKVSYISNGKRQ